MVTKLIKKATRGAANKKKPQKKAISGRKSTLKKVASKKKSASKKPVSSKKVSAKKKVTKKTLPKKTVSKKKVTPKKRVASKKIQTKARKVTPKKKKIIKRKPKTRKSVSKRKPVARRNYSSVRSSRISRPQRKPIKNFIKIKVVGTGGGGGNAITRMRGSFSVRGVEFIAINTDIQDLEVCDAHKRVHIGRALTRGMGAGMNPDLGQQAAEENRSEIAEAIRDADMLFLTAGFGGGTGTGAVPVIADIAREMGILTVAIVTKPFGFEGTERMKIAEDGLLRIKDRVDTLLVIPNDRIFSIIDKNTSVTKAFEKIDEVLQSSVQGVAEVIASSGLVNVDFADIKTIMAGSGMAVVGMGTGTGNDRAVKAVNEAIHSPLLDVSIDGARSVLFVISGGRDMRMTEINEAAKIITEIVDPGARIIFGAYHDRKLKAGSIKVTLIATGFSGMSMRNDSDSLTLFNERLETENNGDSFSSESSPVEKHTPSSSELKDNSTNTKYEGTNEDTGKDEDIWDIPTFLRKKGKRK